MAGNKNGERKLCLWLSTVMAMFASSIAVDGSNDERGQAGPGSSGLRLGKTVM